MNKMEDEKIIEFLITGKMEPAEISEQLHICAYRKKIYIMLHTKNNLSNQEKLIRYLLSLEIAEYDNHHHDNTYDFECYYWCIFLLSRVGNVADVKLLWNAKNIDFDAHCSVDIQFLMGAGVENTISYLEQETDEISKEILKYILICRDNGDFDDLDEWYKYRFEYFIENEE